VVFALLGYKPSCISIQGVNMIYDKDQKGNNIINVNTEFFNNAGEEARRHTQDIPQWHLDNLKEQRNVSTQHKEGEMMKVASIPTAVIEKWMREGFNIMTDKNITAKQIVNKLKSENLDAFLTTEKSL
tara:strand:+ start:206 stop:589 length:384 start_codon:yes stop_codon:yes gene_type:complete